MTQERLLFPDWPDGGIDRPTVCKEKTLTRQSEADACDINFIMKRYEKTGILPVSAKEAAFTDVSEVGSFREALDVIQRAEEGFMQLPAKVRERFGNDAVAFVDFCSDPANLAELQDLGVVEAPEVPAVLATAATGAVAAS